MGLDAQRTQCTLLENPVQVDGIRVRYTMLRASNSSRTRADKLMIKDNGRSIQLRTEWYGVRDRQESFRKNVVFAFARGAINTGNLAGPIYSLLLLYAFATLQNVLLEIRDQGNFASRAELGELFKGSKSKLPWIDYDLVDEGRTMRNKVAHSNFILPPMETFHYLDAIEAELKAFGVV